jgi:hypothetical protein
MLQIVVTHHIFNIRISILQKSEENAEELNQILYIKNCVHCAADNTWLSSLYRVAKHTSLHQCFHLHLIFPPFLLEKLILLGFCIDSFV